MIYLFIFLFLNFFLFLEINIDFKNKLKSEYYLLFIFINIILIIVAGARTVGFDYENYLDIYNTVRLSNYIENGIEIGFAYLISIFNYVGFPFFVFTCFIALISISLKSSFFNEYSAYPFLSLLIYFSITYLISDMGQMRNGLALAIALWAFSDLLENKNKLFFLKIFIAFLFHSSAIIVFPVYFLLKINRLKPMIMVFIIMILFYFVFFDIKSIIVFLSEKLSFSQLESRVALYVLTEDESAPLGLNLSLFLRLLIFTVLILYYNSGINQFKYYDKFIRLYFYGICLYMIFNSVNEFAFRFSNYFKILECVILPMFVAMGKTRWDKNLITFLIILYCSYSIFKILFDPIFGTVYLPYKNILVDFF